MTRAWVIDLLSSIIQASIVTALLAVMGAPTWGAIGFGLLYYLLRPMRAQMAVRA